MPIRGMKARTGTMTLVGGTGVASEVRIKVHARMRGVQMREADRVKLVGRLRARSGPADGIPAGCGVRAVRLP